MVQAIYFDCFSGISGDMALGTLLDAGLPLDAFLGELARLHLPGWEITATREMRGYIAGTRVWVQAAEQTHHRCLDDVRAILDASTLPEQVKAQSLHPENG